MLAMRRSRRRVDSRSSASASSDAPTTAGATVLENRYGRERCRRMSTTAWLAAVYPPAGHAEQHPLRILLIEHSRSSASASSNADLPPATQFYRQLNRVAKQVRPRAVQQDVHHCLAGPRVPACIKP